MTADVHAGAGRPLRVPRGLVGPLVREIGGWLDHPEPAEVAATTAGWDADVGRAARRMIAAHGLAPFLARDPTAGPVLEAVPDALREWIADQGERNRRRVDRLHAELAAALHALAGTGIPVMPLKGAILTTRAGLDPYHRPMADLDLLVRPGDRDTARTALTKLGYRRRPDPHRRPTHDSFELPGNARVVSWDGEDPENPRRIELHVEVRRHLWGWVDDDDLTPLLWTDAREDRVLGEPALLPTERALLAHLAIHATSDLLMARGRLVQWLDLADVADVAGPMPGTLEGMPHPRMAYPALRLAARRLPGRLAHVDLAGLEARVPRRLARWAATVPLDPRAGLHDSRHAEGSSLASRWARWAPYPWRLVVAHGDEPYPLALIRHAARVASIAGRREV